MGIFAIARALQHIDKELFGLLTDDTVASEVAKWDHGSLGSHASAEGRASRVAEAMQDMPELRYLLLGTIAGQSWLRNASLRKMSVDFLVKQSRLDSTETTGAKHRFDVFMSYSSKVRHLVTGIVEGLTEEGLWVRYLEDTEATEI